MFGSFDLRKVGSLETEVPGMGMGMPSMPNAGLPMGQPMGQPMAQPMGMMGMCLDCSMVFIVLQCSAVFMFRFYNW